MTRTHLLPRCILLAVASVAIPASAQIQVNQNGQARDANPRVGSGGLNQRPANLQLYSANDVALGRVTAGRAIRANLTGDPTQPFGGRSSLASDRFSRAANAPVTPAMPVARPGDYVVPFLSANTSPTPANSNFQLNSYTGQFVYRPQTRLGAEDIQFGVPPGTPVIRPSAGGGELLVMPATVRDFTGASANTLITASPLMGIRPLPAMLDEDRFLLTRSASAFGTNQPLMDPVALRRLRDERNRTLLSDAQLAERTRLDAEAALQAQRDATPALTRAAELGSPAITQPLSTPAALQPGLVEPPAQPLGARPLVAPPPRPDPAERNPLLAELRRIEEQRQARQAASPPANQPLLPSTPSSPTDPLTPTPESAPPAAPAPSTPAPSSPPPTIVPNRGETHETRAQANLQIGSLAERQTDAGLKQLIGSAESLVQDGKFASAIDRYEAALKFAPDDPTLIVARAHAEIGGGFFARADASLRQALAKDPASLGGRYDLRKTFSNERTNTLVDDLKRLALDNPNDPMPLRLLGYVAYHTGDAGRAIELLSESLKRSPGDALTMHLLSAWGGSDGK